MSLTTVRLRKMPKTRPQNNPGLEKNNGKGLRQYSTVSEQARKEKKGILYNPYKSYTVCTVQSRKTILNAPCKGQLILLLWGTVIIVK